MAARVAAMRYPQTIASAAAALFGVVAWWLAGTSDLLAGVFAVFGAFIALGIPDTYRYERSRYRDVRLLRPHPQPQHRVHPTQSPTIPRTSQEGHSMSKNKWMVRYVYNGVRLRCYFGTKREANEWRKEYGIKASARRVDY